VGGFDSRKPVDAVHGLVEYLQVERKRVPNEVLWDAERLECLLFLGYDPYFGTSKGRASGSLTSRVGFQGMEAAKWRRD